MSILSVGGLLKYYGPEFVFDDISFQIAHGDRVALVGPNGAGKSTLLKIIAGIERPTRGWVALARGTRVTYLAQESRFVGAPTLIEAMHAAVPQLGVMRRELDDLERDLGDTDHPAWEQRMTRYGELLDQFAHTGGYELDNRVDRMLTGLGFDRDEYDQPIHLLSGGQQTRAALAVALLTGPELLLLDEPTTHLDLAALTWLEDFLISWAGTLVVISHDRFFLNRVTTRTLEIAFGRLDGDYPAGYDGYLELKVARLERQRTVSQQQDVYIAKTEEFIRRYKNSSRRAQAVGRARRLKRFVEGYIGPCEIFIKPRVEAPERQRELHFALEQPQRSGDLVLRFEDLVVGYDQERPLLACPDLELYRGARPAILGPNGSGKTTLLRTLVGQIPPLTGRVVLGHGTHLTYVQQTQAWAGADQTVLETIRTADPQIGEQEARRLLGGFLFIRDDVHKRVSALSGGEWTSLELARMTLLRGNLLVLDEPTNHLDIGARHALEGALDAYTGTLLIVSHDRAFIDAVADVLWVLHDGELNVFDGNYSDYQKAPEDCRL